MLLGLLAATCMGQFDPAALDDDCVADAKGIALVFAERPIDGFELFVKPAGRTWLEIASIRKAATISVGSPWLVFHLGRMDRDYTVTISLDQETPKVEGRSDATFDAYFGEDDFDRSLVLNNFGLHGIY